MRKPAAIYARVSSDRQKENHTIASQTAALIQHAETQGYAVPSEWVFQDEGYSGASLVRPGLEALRDLAAQGHIEAVLAHSPDRLSRKYAYQILLAEEFNRQGVELVFSQGSFRRHAGGPAGGAVSGHDRGIRAGADHRAFAPRQTASGPTRDHQRALGRAVRLSLCEKVGQCDSLL